MHTVFAPTLFHPSGTLQCDLIYSIDQF